MGLDGGEDGEEAGGFQFQLPSAVEPASSASLEPMISRCEVPARDPDAVAGGNGDSGSGGGGGTGGGPAVFTAALPPPTVTSRGGDPGGGLQAETLPRRSPSRSAVRPYRIGGSCGGGGGGEVEMDALERQQCRWVGL